MYIATFTVCFEGVRNVISLCKLFTLDQWGRRQVGLELSPLARARVHVVIRRAGTGRGGVGWVGGGVPNHVLVIQPVYQVITKGLRWRLNFSYFYFRRLMKTHYS